MDIWELALGFMDSQVLLTAVKLGVFDRLDDRPLSAAQLGEATGLPRDSAQRLLNALCALGLVRKGADERYSNGPDASAQLVRGKQGYIGSMFRHVKEDLYPLWNYFAESLMEGRSQWHRAFSGSPAPTEEMYENPDALRSFMEGMHAITYETASEFAHSSPEPGSIETIVDLGGAGGAFLIALAERFPNLRGTVFDLPAVRPIAEDFISRHNLSGRLRFHAGSFWTDPIPSGADAYALGFILHDWDEHGGSILLQKIAEAIRPGGMLIIGEYMLDDDKTGPLHVVRADLNMLVAAHGRERTAKEYSDWIARFGFEPAGIQPVSRGRCYLMARYNKRHET